MCRQGVADQCAGSWYHGDDVGWQTGLHQNIGECQHGKRCELCWLDYNCVTAGQCRCNLPGGNYERKVPGRDQGTHSNWLTQRYLQPGILYRDSFAENLVRSATPVFEHIGNQSYLAPCITNGLASVARLDDCQFF